MPDSIDQQITPLLSCCLAGGQHNCHGMDRNAHDDLCTEVDTKLLLSEKISPQAR
jgi:hypothetical protein